MLMQTFEASVAPIAVTGPGGFIGAAVCRAVLASGGRVIAVGPGAVPRHPSLRHLPDAIDDTNRLADQLEGAGVLIHAAGRGTPAAVDRFDGAIAMGELQLAAQVFEAAARAGVRKVVLVSSGGTVYGDKGQLAVIGENQPALPSSRYGAIKGMIEQMGLSLTRGGQLDCVVARLSNPYGPGQLNLRGQGLIPTLIESLLDGRPIPVWGDGATVRDYLYIDDAADGLLAAARMPGGSICNVSSGIGRSVAAVIADVAETVGRPATVKRMVWRDGGVMRNVLSNALLAERTGWCPSVEWQDGLRRTVQWWVESRDGAARLAESEMVEATGAVAGTLDVLSPVRR